jgi:Uma2 family endonuclease
MVITSSRADLKVEYPSLTDWLQCPIEQTEWVDGQLVTKDHMTMTHGRIQARLAYLLKTHLVANNLGGEVYTDVPCRTGDRGRRPDVAYITPELLNQFGQVEVLPQSFPLAIEIISNTDRAEDIFAKANEYLNTGSSEVWLLLPQSEVVIVATVSQQVICDRHALLTSPIIFPDFSVSVAELIA